MYFSMEYGVPVRTIVGVIFLVLEYFRLKNGLEGNIKESVWNWPIVVSLNLRIFADNIPDDQRSDNPAIANDTALSHGILSFALWSHPAYTLISGLVQL